MWFLQIKCWQIEHVWITSLQRLQSELGVGLLEANVAAVLEDEVLRAPPLLVAGKDCENSMSCTEDCEAVLL